MTVELAVKARAARLNVDPSRQLRYLNGCWLEYEAIKSKSAFYFLVINTHSAVAYGI